MSCIFFILGAGASFDMKKDYLGTGVVCDDARNFYSRLQIEGEKILVVHDGTATGKNTLTELEPLLDREADSIYLMVNFSLRTRGDKVTRWYNSHFVGAIQMKSKKYKVKETLKIPRYQQVPGGSVTMQPIWLKLVRGERL